MSNQNNNNKRKKKIIALLLALTLVIVLGSVFALFTDVINLPAFNSKSGTLDIAEVSGKELALVRTNNENVPLTDPVAPGDTFGFTGEIVNNGNLDAKIKVSIERTDSSTGTWTTTNTSTDTILPGGDTLDINALGISLLYDLTNVNAQQNEDYAFTLKVEALQDRNTTGTSAEWQQVVALPFEP